MATASPIPEIRDRSYGILALRYLPSLIPSPSTSTPVPNLPPPTSKTTQLLLIFQRTIILSDPPFWTIPKGHAEPYDTDLQATAIRELREETGLVATSSSILSFPLSKTLQSSKSPEAVVNDSEITINPPSNIRSL